MGVNWFLLTASVLFAVLSVRVPAFYLVPSVCMIALGIRATDELLMVLWFGVAAIFLMVFAGLMRSGKRKDDY